MVVGKVQRRIILKKLSGLQNDFEIFHVSLAARIGENPKAHYAIIAMPPIVTSNHRPSLS